ncbi:MAG: TlpA family protein disulfide reductase [Polyangiaceae bacterium]|nr:TlpA family protein disulfide reductase [Polyangiaceae bacterium]
MRRLVFPGLALTSLLTVACGSSDPPPPTEEAQQQKTGNGTGGTTGSTTGTTVDYPKGPFAAVVGGVLRDADFNALVSPVADNFDMGKAKKLSFSDYYNPTSVDTKPRVLVITEAGRWCAPCKDEAKASMGAYNAWNPDHSKPVVQFISLVIENTNYEPAVIEDASLWAKAYGLVYPVGIDPSLKLGDFFDKSAIPFNMIVDTKTMTIVYAGTGGIELAPGTSGGDKIQAVLGN